MKPTIPEVLPLIRELYAQPGCALGCCLYTITENSNYEQATADYCLEAAQERQHPRCVEVLQLLVQMSNTQRKKLSSMPHYSWGRRP